MSAPKAGLRPARPPAGVKETWGGPAFPCNAMARALLIAGPASGQGKTSFTCALARRLVRQGHRVQAFKIGPDFIDPGFLAEATGEPVHNLDLWMVGEDHCTRLLAQAAARADWILIEGAMGLYDGNPSAADLAARLCIPVLGVIDASAMAETFGAVALGLQAYGRLKGLQWAGVAANRVASAGHARMLRDSLLPELAWVGQLSRSAHALPERHLGLVQASELRADGLQAVWQALDDALEVDLLRLDRLAPWRAPDLVAPATVPELLSGRHIAVARDEAFSFCYEANLDVLRAMGARIETFSPLANEALPAECDAVYLPGGYPELHAQRLSQARRFLHSLRAHHAQGRPIVAECGGMMVCAESLRTLDGEQHLMAGLLQATAVMGDRIAGLGLQSWSTPQGELRGHAFHYGRLEVRSGLVPHALTQPRRYGGPEAVFRVGSLTASFFHGYFASCPAAAAALFQRAPEQAPPT